MDEKTFYRLTMRDSRVLLIPTDDINEQIRTLDEYPGHNFETRCRQLNTFYPGVIDWEMIDVVN